jgi:hypothetical protein
MLKQETIDRAIREIGKGYAQYQYFFDRLNTPAWLDALFLAGFFKKPPEPIRNGQYISFPLWPESLYLVRMAGIPEAQETVLKIALTIPPSENSRVHDDLADIALSLQPMQAARLVPQICASIEYPVTLLLPEKLGNLIVHLAEGGQGRPAITLAGVALALSPDPQTAEKEGEDSIFSPEPQSQFRDWYYARIVDKAVPALAKASGLEAVRLFCGLLNEAIQLSRKRQEEGDEEDYLYIKHPAIEQGANPDDIPSLLLCATRDTAQLVIQEDRTLFPSVLALLQERTWISFRRLELHISRIFLEQGQSEAERFFAYPEIMSSSSLRHEAVLLLKAAFPALTTDTQQRVLSWMDAGPEAESVRRWLEFVGTEVTDEKIRDYSERERRDRFSILEGQLPEPYRTLYEELKSQMGVPNPPDRISAPRFGAISSQSPKTQEELEQMPVGDVLAFLKSWIPGHDIFSPTADGLGASLGAAVSQRPAEFATVAEDLTGLDPTYVRSFFGGLNSAIKEGLKFDWRPVLELGLGVVGQQREIEGRKGGMMDADPDWGWTRDSVIDLLSVGFEALKDKPPDERLPFGLRPMVWDVLNPLTNDPNPSAKDELGEKFDPAFLAMNSTRGRALEAVVAYAWWVRRCTDAERKAPEQPPVTFEAMPEVRQVLDNHLEVAKEPTLAIRSIYGRLLTSIAILDLDWLQTSVDRILPPGQDDPPRFNAAWESFIGFNQPHPRLLSVLMPAYQRAVRQIADTSQTKRRGVSPEDRLAEHLMVYYWLGKLSVGGEDRLLDGFYGMASDGLRGHAMWFVGTSISKWNDEAPPEIFERLRDLFQRRLKVAQQAASAEPFTKELSNFGFWFTSKKFEERWSIETLLATLQLTRKTQAEMEVVKLLAERCPQNPVECVTCLRLMVEGDTDRWLLLGVEEDAKKILRLAIESNNAEASLSARRLTEHLIARGNFGFTSVLR